MSINSIPVELKLAKARTQLILDKPFLGTLVMHLPMKKADASWCATTATDASNFYFNPEYIDRLTVEQTQFVLAHEAMHCALSHFARRQPHFTKHRWDVACDYAVNMILDDERMRGPENALLNDIYRGLTANEIYHLLHEDPPEQPQDLHLFDNDAQDSGGEGESQEQDQGEGRGDDPGHERGSSSGGQARQEEGGEQGQGEGQGGGQGQDETRQPPPPPSDPQQLDEQWKSRLAAAAQTARQAGKLSQSLMRFIDDLLAPQLPWRALLARYLINAARDDYSFQRTSRRETAALLPRLHSQSVNVVVALDTSGSVHKEELQEFLSEIDALKGQVRAQVTLHACDDQLDAHGPWHFALWESMKLPEQLSGGGGTDFRPVFDWLEREQSNPDLLVYFTDAQGRFPQREPHYPTVWLVKGKAPVPFGVRIQLN